MCCVLCRFKGKCEWGVLGDDAMVMLIAVSQFIVGDFLRIKLLLLCQIDK